MLLQGWIPQWDLLLKSIQMIALNQTSKSASSWNWATVNSNMFFISGSLPPLRKGIKSISRLLGLNKWLRLMCPNHGIRFNDNFNTFCNCKDCWWGSSKHHWIVIRQCQPVMHLHAIPNQECVDKHKGHRTQADSLYFFPLTWPSPHQQALTPTPSTTLTSQGEIHHSHLISCSWAQSGVISAHPLHYIGQHDICHYCYRNLTWME